MSQARAVLEDEDAYLERLYSYQVDRWFAKPDSITPQVCASFGWSNTDVDLLECHTCKAKLRYESTTSILDEDNEDREQTFLQNMEWEHDADCVWCENRCPFEFLAPEPKISKLVTSFKRIWTVWDLPVLETIAIDQPTTELLQSLGERLEGEWKKSISPTVAESTFDSTEWKERKWILTLLSLTGWDLNILDYPMESTVGEDGTPELKQGISMMCPEETGYCSAFQSVLFCERCTASVGLWMFEQQPPFVPLEHFQEISKPWMKSCAQIVIDPETGEVKDLLQRTYSTMDAGVGEKYESRTETEGLDHPNARQKRSLSLDDDSGRSPVFGLKRFKKERLPSGNDHSRRHSIIGDDCTPSKPRLDPIGEHRYFCPCRNLWKSNLKNLVT